MTFLAHLGPHKRKAAVNAISSMTRSESKVFSLVQGRPATMFPSMLFSVALLFASAAAFNPASVRFATKASKVCRAGEPVARVGYLRGRVE